MCLCHFFVFAIELSSYFCLCHLFVFASLSTSTLHRFRVLAAPIKANQEREMRRWREGERRVGRGSSWTGGWWEVWLGKLRGKDRILRRRKKNHARSLLGRLHSPPDIHWIVGTSRSAPTWFYFDALCKNFSWFQVFLLSWTRLQRVLKLHDVTHCTVVGSWYGPWAEPCTFTEPQTELWSSLCPISPPR